MRTVILTVQERVHLSETLRAKIGGEVFIDPYRVNHRVGVIAAISHHLSLGGGDLLLLEDDIIPCADFHSRVRDALSANTLRRPVSFFTMGKESKTALDRGFHWIEKTTHSWWQATFIPGELLVPFLDFDKTISKKLVYGCVDFSLFCGTLGIKILVTTPNLVDHMEVPSTLRRSTGIFGRPRVSSAFLGNSTMTIDWHRTYLTPYKSKVGFKFLPEYEKWRLDSPVRPV